MRGRLLFILLAIVVVGGFAALNWPEFTRTTQLNFGVARADASLGGIMLAALGLTLLVFLISATMHESRNLIEWNRHSKALQAQRDLAERAETSRFTELRQHIDTTLRESRQREAIAANEFEKSMVQSQRELRNELEQMNRTLNAQLGELERRIDAPLQRLPAAETAVRTPDLPPADINPSGEPPRRRMNV